MLGRVRSCVRRSLGCATKRLGGFVHQSYFVVAMCSGIVMGMIIGLVLRVGYFWSPLWVVLAVVLLVLIYLNPRMIFMLVAFGVGVILAFSRVAGSLGGEKYVQQFYGKEILVAGVVDGDPEADEGEAKLKLKNLKFGEEVEVKGELYVTLRGSPELVRGDMVVLTGKLSEGFGTYMGYLYKPKIGAIYRPEPGDLILKVRNWFAERIRRLIPETESALGLSYLLGMKTGLPDDLNEKLRMVGLVHIVVASGAHLSILVEVARKIFGKISRLAGVVFSVVFVVFFMSMAGWTPSIMRAGVMAILTLVAWQTGRKFAPWRIILLVAAFTLMLNPMFLINLGWLLSFASYAGIMILGPWLAKFFYGERKPGFVASTILTTIAATATTLPITLYYYGEISLISVVANLLILPTLPYVMGLVFMTGVLAGVPWLEVVIAWVAKKALGFHIMVVEFFGEMRQFMVKIEPYQVWVFGLYFVVVGLVVWWGVKKWKSLRRGGEVHFCEEK